MKKKKRIILPSLRGEKIPVKARPGSLKKKPATLVDPTIYKLLQFHNQERILWRDEKYTKGDLLKYYERIGPVMLPYLENRPHSLHRFPNGINEESIFENDLDPGFIPERLLPNLVHSIPPKTKLHYLVCNDIASLLYMVDMDCIEMNPWNSRIFKIEYPDWMVLDLDPEQTTFEEVVNTALITKETLDDLELNSYVKTSGGAGLHIYIPLGAKYNYHAVTSFTHLLADIIHEKLPDTTNVIRFPSKRGKKVTINFLHNDIGQTVAAPYSVRPNPGAPVSTPLDWSELTPVLDPASFTIQTIFERLDKVGDIWEPVLGKGENIMGALKKIQDIRN
jgi:bifunctional non-homologous end joining protein LigD